MSFLEIISKRQTTSDKEQAELARQLDRLDRWTHQLAAKIGHKLVA